jgi:hypothetical protein
MPISLRKPHRSERYMGEKNVPSDVRRRRRSVYEMLRRMGTPMLVKHRLNDQDVQAGTATQSPVYSEIYGQTRNEDPLSYGAGYVSVELSPDEWYNDEGVITTSQGSPGSGWVQAPLYRGFGKGELTWIIEPDRAQDYYKATTGGPLFKVQEATAIAPWWPNIDDNDLLINVVLDRAGTIIDTGERFEAKMVNPISMRGLDRRGRKEYGEDGGNRFVVNQSFEMARIPENNVLYSVPVDR